jgi:NitT/TauT family transport system ATP-binding protein
VRVDVDDLDVNRGGRLVLRGVTFQVESGGRLAVVGASGSGKTSLLRVVAGLDDHIGGRVTLDGSSVDTVRSQGRISIAFQEPTLLPWATTLDNVLLPVRLRGRTQRSDVGRARDLLRLLEIDEAFWGARPTALSGEMRQRVALAAALVTQPAVLLLDEPFASVDEITRYRLLGSLDDVLAQHRPTCLLVTHSVNEAMLFADRVLVLGGEPTAVVDVVPAETARPRLPSHLTEPSLAGAAGRVLRALGWPEGGRA